MSDHLVFVQQAENDIAEDGRDVTLVSFIKDGPSYDPIVTPVKTKTKALEVGFNRREIDNGLASATSKVFLMPASSNVSDDMKVIDDTEFSITSIVRIKPGDQLVMYRVVVDA